MERSVQTDDYKTTIDKSSAVKSAAVLDMKLVTIHEETISASSH